MIEGHLSFRPDRFRTSAIVLLEIANVIAHFGSSGVKSMLINVQHSKRERWESYMKLVLEIGDSLLFKLTIFSSFGSNLIPKPRTRSQSGEKIRQVRIKHVKAWSLS